MRMPRSLHQAAMPTLRRPTPTLQMRFISVAPAAEAAAEEAAAERAGGEAAAAAAAPAGVSSDRRRGGWLSLMHTHMFARWGWSRA